MNAAMIERLALRAGAKVLTCDGAGEGDTPEAMLMRTMIDAFAQYERQILKVRTKAERISSRVPYGMQLASDSISLEPHTAEQAVIAEAKALHHAGLSTRTIATRLAEQNLLSRAGPMFAPSAISAMVGA